MKNKIMGYALSALLLVALAVGWGLWQFNIACKRELEQSIRQYSETMSKLDSYAALRQKPTAIKTAPRASLFAQASQLSAEFGLSRRVETLRPSGDAQKGRESLDLQVKSLYLAEFARFLQAIEALEQVTVERMSLARSASRLLDVELRIARALPES